MRGTHSAAADVQYRLSAKQVLVAQDCILIRFGPDLVFQHLLMNTEMCVRVEVIVFTGHLVVVFGPGCGCPAHVPIFLLFSCRTHDTR